MLRIYKILYCLYISTAVSLGALHDSIITDLQDEWIDTASVIEILDGNCDTYNLVKDNVTINSGGKITELSLKIYLLKDSDLFEQVDCSCQFVRVSSLPFILDKIINGIKGCPVGKVSDYSKIKCSKHHTELGEAFALFEYNMD